MAIYNINLLLILALAFPLCLYKPSKIKSALYLALTFGYMWFIAAFRYGIGFDYDVYIEFFGTVRQTAGLSALWNLPFEFGFVLFTKGMSFFITGPIAMYGVYAAVIMLPVIWFIYTYCKDVWLSTWLYVTLTFFYGSMNFTRQSIACSITLLGYKFLREKKLVPYLSIVILATSFHKTALIMIPVYFLCHLKLTKKLAIFYSVATLVMFAASSVLLDFVTDYIFKDYKGTPYLTAGFDFVYLIIPVMIFVACLSLKHVWEKRDADAGMLINLMMFSTIIWLFLTKHFILERFSMYLYIFVLVALPAAISCLKAPAEDYAQRDAWDAEGDKKSMSKEERAKRHGISIRIREHKKYYWSAVIAVLLITTVYNSFGAYDGGGFHGVFPYRSVLEWLGSFK